MIQPPTYEDGFFDLFRIKTDETKDYPEEHLVNQNIKIWYREMSVFDRIRYEFSQSDIEITAKIRIPMYKSIDSKCVCLIEGRQHSVYNATHVKDKNGFPETELTLIRPGKELEVK